jgi:monovalent cation/hydrogen antiporter
MSDTTVYLGLLLAALVIAAIAKRLDQPYPIALVLGGVAIGLAPGLPQIRLNPEVVFFLLLPPILSEAAYFTSWRDFVRWRRPILLLAFGLVTATSAAIAAICALLIPGMTWATGFVLGAIVSPPDASAATTITRGLGLPRRIVQVLEGESLVNDAAALTVYRFAVAAVVTGTFSWGEALLSFVWIAAGGTAIGIALGLLFVKVFPRIKDPQVEILSTFLLSYGSYFVAETVHASGVLAAVASGLLLGWHSSELFSASVRIRATAVWQTVLFLINALVFVLIGVELPPVIASLGGYPPGELLWWSAAVAITAMAVRMAWVFPGAYLPRLLSARIRSREAAPPPAQVFVVGWTGLRGVVSLAAALALPVETAGGLPFPYRNLILLLTFAVILSTLLLQGLTLRPLVRLLGLPKDRSSEEEQLSARIRSTERVLERVSEMEVAKAAPAPVLERVRGFFEDRMVELRSRLESETGTEQPARPEGFRSIAEQRVWWELSRVERDCLREMRRKSEIGDEAMREIERDIDLLEARIVPQS